MAAQWSFVRVVHLNGEIELGDSLKLKHLLRGHEDDKGWYGNYTLLSLNSVGGDLSEALKIIQLVKSETIPTYVSAGATCLSACALIFMAGTQSWDVGNVFFGRFLDIHGTLGFHAPYPSAGEGDFGQGIGAIADIFEALGQFDSGLYYAMLTTPRGEFAFADTLERVGAWQIQLAGYETPDITRQALLTACYNIYRWHEGAEPPETVIEVPAEKIQLADFADQQERATVVPWDGGLHYRFPWDPYSLPQCDVAAAPAEEGDGHSGTGIEVWYTDRLSSLAWGDEESPAKITGIPAWWLLSPDLKIDEVERTSNPDPFAFLDSSDVYGGIGP